MRSALRCGAGTVAVVVLASADDLLLNDVVAIPVLAAVRHGHRSIATAVSLVVPAVTPLLIGVVVVRRRLRIAIRRRLRIAIPWSRLGTVVAAVVVRVAVARRRRRTGAARCAIAVVWARRHGHGDARNEHQSRKEPQHLHSSKPRCLNARHHYNVPASFSFPTYILAAFP